MLSYFIFCRRPWRRRRWPYAKNDVTTGTCLYVLYIEQVKRERIYLQLRVAGRGVVVGVSQNTGSAGWLAGWLAWRAYCLFHPCACAMTLDLVNCRTSLSSPKPPDPRAPSAPRGPELSRPPHLRRPPPSTFPPPQSSSSRVRYDVDGWTFEAGAGVGVPPPPQPRRASPTCFVYCTRERAHIMKPLHVDLKVPRPISADAGDGHVRLSSSISSAAIKRRYVLITNYTT